MHHARVNDITSPGYKQIRMLSSKKCFSMKGKGHTDSTGVATFF